MKRLALAAMLGLMALAPAQAQTTVTYLNIASIPAEVELMKQAADEYMAANPDARHRVPTQSRQKQEPANGTGDRPPAGRRSA